MKYNTALNKFVFTRLDVNIDNSNSFQASRLTVWLANIRLKLILIMFSVLNPSKTKTIKGLCQSAMGNISHADPHFKNTLPVLMAYSYQLTMLHIYSNSTHLDILHIETRAPLLFDYMFLSSSANPLLTTSGVFLYEHT